MFINDKKAIKLISIVTLFPGDLKIQPKKKGLATKGLTRLKCDIDHHVNHQQFTNCK